VFGKVTGDPEPTRTRAGLLGKIDDHNRYNGFWFSAAEFGITGILAAAAAGYFASVGRWLPALVAVGITANCVPVVVAALRDRLRGVQSIGWSALASVEVRARIRADRPHLLRDTLTITALTLLPFGSAVVLLTQRITTPIATSRGGGEGHVS
jgi:hypothetical protein